jgi:hypothetical protein
VLCPNCHFTEHYRAGEAIWGRNNQLRGIKASIIVRRKRTAKTPATTRPLLV